MSCRDSRRSSWPTCWGGSGTSTGRRRDYRGEIKCIVVNLSNEPQTIEPGERIAQMVIARYEQIVWEEVSKLNASERGAGGFGSTTKKS